MKTLISIIAFLPFVTATSAFADDPSGVGLKGIKSVVNSVCFTSTSLDNTKTSADIVKKEQEVVESRTLHVDQVTAMDSMLEKIEMNSSSLYFKIAF
ncbi:MAG: hypothetical protein JWQ35_1319 [Bacteriovoracaceae bacterium]|nr:hypothetical protein [Bacteriovoracaceae bacterium]